MKKIFRVVLVMLVFLIGGSAAFVNAQDIPEAGQGASGVATSGNASVLPIPPYPAPDQPFPLGQSHYYTLTLRGNGETLVTLKTVFTNREEASISAVKATFPYVPKDVTVYQAIRDPQCSRYEPMSLEQEKLLMLSSRWIPPQKQKCLEYQEPDYRGWGVNTSYKKATISLNGKELSITLPQEIKPNGSGSYLISFGSQDIAKKDIFGAFSFNFETIKVGDKIQDLQVGINADPEYYLKEAKGDINYQTKTAVAEAMPATMDTGGAMVRNAQFDSYYNQIGSGMIMKHAANLQPNESFTVKGMYADKRIKLYGKEISYGVGGILLGIILAAAAFFFGIKWLLRNTSQPEKTTETKTQVKRFEKMTVISILGLSFGSSILIMLYSLLLYGINYYVNQSYYYSYNNTVFPIFLILLLIISLSIYILFLFVPGIFIGIKKGFVPGILTVVLTILWLIFYGVLLGIFFLLFSQKPNTPGPVYPLRSDVMKVMPAAGAAEATADVAVPLPASK